MSANQLDDYKDKGDRLFQRMPPFNVLHLRWFENLEAIYQGDVVHVATLTSKQMDNVELQDKLKEATAQLEVVSFIVEQIKAQTK